MTCKPKPFALRRQQEARTIARPALADGQQVAAGAAVHRESSSAGLSFEAPWLDGSSLKYLWILDLIPPAASCTVDPALIPWDLLGESM